MLRKILIFALILSVTSLTHAQERRERGGRGWGPGEGDRRRGGGGPRMERMFDRLVDDLQLDEAQREEYDEILAPYREQMQSMREARREMMEAMRNGDEDQARELREQFREEYPNPFELMQQAMDDVEPILNNEQFDRFTDMREQWSARRARMEEGRRAREDYREMMEELPEELNMTEAQREQFDRILQERRKTFRERMMQMRPLWQEIREAEAEAEESGDTTRIDQLREKMESLRPNEDQMRAELIESVEKILNEDQKKTFGVYIEQRGLLGGGEETIQANDVRLVLMAAKRVSMDERQKKQLREIWRLSTREMRAVKSSDKRALAKISEDTKRRIDELLDQDQQKEFEEQIQGLKARNKR